MAKRSEILISPSHDTEPDAETIAIAALSHIATDGETLARFFALTGVTPHSLRATAVQPGFLASVLEFILQDDRLVTAVAAAQRVPPEVVVRAHARLVGRRAVDPDG